MKKVGVKLFILVLMMMISLVFSVCVKADEDEYVDFDTDTQTATPTQSTEENKPTETTKPAEEVKPAEEKITEQTPKATTEGTKTVADKATTTHAKAGVFENSFFVVATIVLTLSIGFAYRKLKKYSF